MQRQFPTPRRQSCRQGVSALDVIVTIIVLLMLMALLFPACSTPRTVARRSSCKNNLKQLGLALHNYHEAHNTFPPGWVANQLSDAVDPVEGHGWVPPILSEMEQTELSRKFEPGPLNQEPCRQLATTHLPVMRCPSSVADSQVETSLIPNIAVSDYVGNFGVGMPEGLHDPRRCQGTFGCNSRVRIRDIKDGTTNVFMVGERRVPREGSDWMPGYADGNFSSYWAGIPDLKTVSPLCIVGTTLTGDINKLKSSESLIAADATVTESGVRFIGVNKLSSGELIPDDGPISAGFSSWHIGGAQFLLSDGSVRFIGENVDANTFVNLSRRSDGQTLGRF